MQRASVHAPLPGEVVGSRDAAGRRCRAQSPAWAYFYAVLCVLASEMAKLDGIVAYLLIAVAAHRAREVDASHGSVAFTVGQVRLGPRREMALVLRVGRELTRSAPSVDAPQSGRMWRADGPRGAHGHGSHVTARHRPLTVGVDAVGVLPTPHGWGRRGAE